MAPVALLGVAAGSGAIELGSADAGVLAVVLLWFLLGFLFYSSLYAISGVIVSRRNTYFPSPARACAATMKAWRLRLRNFVMGCLL